MSETERIRVLIVDDHQMVAQGLGEALSEEPDIQIVGTVGTVEAARRQVREAHPDVVLMDYLLPDGDGAHATELIKAEQQDTKVLMVTSFVDDAILAQAIEAGCSGFVTKERPVEELVSAVRAAHAGEALISPSMLARLLPKLRRTHRGLGSDLTPREIEILRMLADGMSNQAIADKLVISLKTVRNHVQSVISKLHAHSKLEAVATASREGIIRFP